MPQTNLEKVNMTVNAFGPPTSKSIANYVKRNAPKVKQALTMKMSGMGAESLRETDYKGHHIGIQTVYRIKVDGRPFAADLGVMNNGQVHYHAIPNMTFDSAIDLVKALIDVFPDDFSKEAIAQGGRRNSMQGGGMRGMKMRSKVVGKKSKSKKPK
jgi:hypothetical protein